MGFFAEKRKTKQEVGLCYGSVDTAGKDGKPDGKLMTYDADGKWVGKKRLGNVETHVEAIKGEVWANDPSLPQPGMVPLDGVEEFKSRLTVRPIRDNWGLSEYSEAFFAAVRQLSNDPTYGDGMRRLLAEHSVELPRQATA